MAREEVPRTNRAIPRGDLDHSPLAIPLRPFLVEADHPAQILFVFIGRREDRRQFRLDRHRMLVEIAASW